jgi:glyoxylase-like metal-dependent hydrolase (beta-lactamase superfamily II)/3-mercaptopyruvate sulfurtransferase SseA
MFFKQFYLGCLAQASYMIGSRGEAVVVDPRRDVDEYLDEARSEGLVIRHVIETHLHADFVSGHRELADLTGAKIYFGARARARFPHQPVRDGDEILVGDVSLKFWETPGHTPESICIVVSDPASSDAPRMVLTGDTLFIGDVGRPDLAAGQGTPQELARQLYASLHEKLLTLPDSVAVYPGHGAGSLCGKNISSETSSTIGDQRRFNYALRPMSREEFVNLVTADLPEAPAYFSRDADLNRGGPGNLADLPAVAALSPGDVEDRMSSGALLLDTRPSAQYGTGHVPGSVHIGLSGQFASWAGTLLSPQMPIILITEDEDRVAEARTRLARVGLENVVGYLDGGILAWHQSGRPLASTEQIAVDELSRRIASGDAEQVLDVRRPGEWKAGHIERASHLPLHELEVQWVKLDRQSSVAIICASGFRSSFLHCDEPPRARRLCARDQRRGRNERVARGGAAGGHLNRQIGYAWPESAEDRIRRARRRRLPGLAVARRRQCRRAPP